MHLNVKGVTEEDFKAKSMLEGDTRCLGPRGTFAHLFSDFPFPHKTFLDESGAFCCTQAYPSELMDIFCVAGTVEQAEQPNYLAEGQTPF
eukprot:1158456-Pelagomonas_calceolata.AAC.9